MDVRLCAGKCWKGVTADVVQCAEVLRRARTLDREQRIVVLPQTALHIRARIHELLGKIETPLEHRVT